MTEPEAIAELEKFAGAYDDGVIQAKKASIALDETQDGELVSRVMLLLTDPDGDTWDVDRVNAMRTALGTEATRLGLPPVTLTLVAESEREDAGVFTE